MNYPVSQYIEAALGKVPCDLVIRNVDFLDVFSLQFRKGDIAVYGGKIVATDAGLKGKREVDGRKRCVVPGFIDAHVHVESSLMVPNNFDSFVLRRGTTTAICDPHELANVVGVKGIEYFLRIAEKMQMDLRVMLSSCVPATHMETNGGGVIKAADLLLLRNHTKALGLAEMMNVPGVLNLNSDVMDKLIAFGNGVIDGHCPGLRGCALSAYIGSGISSCHESSQLDEAMEKHSKGMAVWIREGSVAKDLQALHPLLTESSIGIGFCTDDRNPLDITEEGHIDYLVRTAIKKGTPPCVAYRAASWSAANHYGLKHKGAIAPGKDADFIVLEDVDSVQIQDVYRLGILAGEMDFKIDSELIGIHSICAREPNEIDLKGPEGRVHIIEVIPGKIVTGRSVDSHNALGVARLAVLERYGKNSRPACGYVRGFGVNLNGAIASSVGHDSHNLIVVGSNLKDMCVGIKSLIQSGGGFSIIQNGSVIELLELPIGGLMTSLPPSTIVDRLRSLRRASRAIGCDLNEPFLQLAFLSLPVIPTLKLTDRGLVDVDLFKIISVAA